MEPGLFDALAPSTEQAHERAAAAACERAAAVEFQASNPSSNRLADLEARCLELERNLTGKDAQLVELHEMAKRTARELERKERQVEEVKLHCSTLTQKLEESETETAAIASRAQELELEVQRLAAFREERERRRKTDGQERVRGNDGRERVDSPSGVSDFDRAVRDVNLGVGDYRDLPTLAALRTRLYDHKDSLSTQRTGSVGSPRVSTATARRAAARTASALSTPVGSGNTGSSSTNQKVESPTSKRAGKRPPQSSTAQDKGWR